MPESYISSVSKDSQMILVYSMISLLSFFIIISYETPQEKFVIFIFTLTAIGYYYSYTSNVIDKANTTVSKFNKEEDAIQNTDFSVEKVYQIQKKPKSFRYLTLHDDIIQITNKLTFLRTFDNYAYENLLVLLENFFRIYYNVLVEDYDCRTSYPVLKDLRLEILNNVTEFYLNVPQFSNNVKGNIYEILDINLNKIRAITFRCLKIVSHQAKKLHNVDLMYNDPSPNDPHENIGKLYA